MEKVEIIYHGHSMFEIRSRELTIIIDPYNEEIKSILPDVSADIVFVSHDHFDHSNISIVEGNPFIVNEILKESIKGIIIEGIDSDHDTQNGQIRGKNIIFKFTINGIIFVHLGDLGHNIDFKIAKKLKNVDILMIPVGGTYTINFNLASEIVNKLTPSVVIPMHYKEDDSKLDVDKVDSFLRKWPDYKKVGHSIKISKNNLPSEGTEVWVLDSK